MKYDQSSQLNIAVIGGGVAGLVAAYLLQRRHRVSLFERNDYVGGHTNTIEIPSGPDAGTPVDTGFIVLNDKTYPLFTKLLSQLDCAVRYSDMSFGYYDEGSGLQYAGTGLSGLFANRRDLLRPAHWRFLMEIARFCRRARADLAAGKLANMTVSDYLRDLRISDLARDAYIYPMASAIWSSSLRDISRFPAEMMIRFWENHGLLSLEDRPRWQTVVGGSRTYVKKLLGSSRIDCSIRARVERIERLPGRGVRVCLPGGMSREFDVAVIATHADEALHMLADPSPEERRLLGAWRYQENRAVLHTDESLMPPNRRAWASWNYRRHRGSGEDRPVAVTYHMNRLQGLSTRRQYFVSLNVPRPPRDESVIREMTYTHPLYSFDALRSQAELPSLNGPNRTFFCGSYFGYGFHEDAVRSAVAVARQFGIDL
ncbi:MAG: FAD-dependent oxidoreductase [Kiritimatiellae bacterium]|nr:FAD-dependent oxidoreductase [Kiritimatiellia bacterium]MDW8458503.1 FAD-dependent oxidoreductase [Verrucomicrobiota bacterium]